MKQKAKTQTVKAEKAQSKNAQPKKAAKTEAKADVLKNTHKARVSINESGVDAMIYHPLSRSANLAPLQQLDVATMKKTKKIREKRIAYKGFAFSVKTDSKNHWYERKTVTGASVFGDYQALLKEGFEEVTPDPEKRTTIQRPDKRQFVGALLAAADNGVTSILSDEGHIETGEPRRNSHNEHQVGVVVQGG